MFYLFEKNHAAFEKMNTLLRQTSPLFEQYLNEFSEVCHNKIGTCNANGIVDNLQGTFDLNFTVFEVFKRYFTNSFGLAKHRLIGKC